MSAYVVAVQPNDGVADRTDGDDSGAAAPLAAGPAPDDNTRVFLAGTQGHDDSF